MNTNNIIGWLLFLFATVVYLITLEPTVSFWDCGEYIATAYKLQVGHPPGAPLFQMIGRFFTLFAFGDTTQVARMINILSAISSGLTIMFLYWTIIMLARKLFNNKGGLSTAERWVVYGSGIIGALAFTFSDSFWFSAVEGEVYAMSTLFTAITFWAILKWEVSDARGPDLRWIILIAYLTGLSIGVHLLNLLAIPAVALVYYFKVSQRPDWKKIIGVLAFSFVILGVILYGIIPEVITLFAGTELFFVNSLGLPFNSGTIFFALLLITLITLGLLQTNNFLKLPSWALILLSGILAILFLIESSSVVDFLVRLLGTAAVTALFYYKRGHKVLLNTILLSLTFLLIGYSSFIMLVIRSNANPPIDENNPENAISLLSYLNREQYGSYPLFHGQYYNAPMIERIDGKPVYEKDESRGEYVISDPKTGIIPVYDPEYETIFPRMWSSHEKRYIRDYKNWSGIRNDPDNKHIPAFSENLRYFFRYQVNHMFLRYFLWNFAGKQNEEQGMFNDLKNGNWLSGISFIDNPRLGPQDQVPDSLGSMANNHFYFLPLIFGIIGLLFHFRKDYKGGMVVLALFLMTGLAVVIYLNQHSPQPRERDYAYAASFYAFTIWIGLSLVPFFKLMRKKTGDWGSAVISFVILAVLVPVLMASQGWDDHNRSGRYTALQMAKNYLNSCAPNAILFTNGDNDTFPLWYAQEVEDFRTDVRVVNLSLLQADWYIDQARRKAYDSDPVPFTLERDQYKNGTRDYVFLIEKENIKGHVEARELFDIIKTDASKLRVKTVDGTFDFFPTRNFGISVDPAQVLANNVVPEKDSGRIVDIEWRIDRQGLVKNYFMMLDLIAHMDWTRPVYFATTTGPTAYLQLEEYFQLEGLAYRLVPIKTPKVNGMPARVNTGVMYDNLMNKFEYDVSTPGFFMNSDNLRMFISMRNTYARLAGALADEGDLERAVLVADRSLELMPDEVQAYDYFNMPLAIVYYKSGMTEKGDQIIHRLWEIQDEQLGWYFSFSKDQIPSLIDDIQDNFAMLNAMRQVVLEFKRDELLQQIEQGVETYYSLYTAQQL